MPTQFGSVYFENSCKPQAAADLNRGVALLHSFWHDEAGRAFESAAAKDRECAMAYWGQAMASFHLYSATPTPEDLAAGRRALSRAARAREKTRREAAYLRALSIVYEGYKPAQNTEFARRYAQAMRGVVARHPNDLEAKAFYALALLASETDEDVSLANSREAVAVLSPLFREHPDHPGLAHYIIHACDNPQMAQQALEAARHYASIAPAAPHAVHMPSHIFARLGLWEDDIRSNLASKAAAEGTGGMHVGGENRLHAMEFLEYAYLQSGRFDEARAIATEAETVKAADVRYGDYYLTVEARFPALLGIETQNWEMAANLQPVAGAHWYSHATTLLANAVAAGHRRDASGGIKAAETLDALIAKIPALPTGSSAANLRDEIYAWRDFSQGNMAAALERLRPIAERQEKVGKGEVELPAREMLGEMLFLAGQPADALNEYERSLRSDPNRFNGLLGAAKAAEQSGRSDVAAKYYRELAANCPAPSGSAVNVLAEARIR